MDHFSEQKLSKIFFLNTHNSRLIGSRESTTLDFKQAFHTELTSLADYAKAMASFANKEGGYLVFGVKDKPRELIGVERTHFDQFDPAPFSEKLNEFFQPAIEWESKVYDWNGLSFGIIYTFEAKNKPVMAVKSQGDIKSGDIYYRYNGRTERIKYAELDQLIKDKMEKERNAWKRIFDSANSIGPSNAAVMDTIAGTVSGPGGTLVIDEALIPKIKFIREGKFNERDGAPTLKLVGDVVPVPITAIRERRVTVGQDIYIFRPTDVAQKVHERIGRNFTIPLHTKSWKKYGGHPSPNEQHNQFSEYKPNDRVYRYSQAWIDFLVNKLASEHEYMQLLTFRD